jgi:hypothetical protein
VARPSPPLMFLGALGALWIGARVVVATWGGGDVASDEARSAAGAEGYVADAAGGVMPELPTQSASSTAPGGKAGTVQRRVRSRVIPVWSIVPPSGQLSIAVAPMPTMQSVGEVAIDGHRLSPPAFVVSVATAQPAPPAADRWTLSGWVFVRPMSAPTTLGQGLLGGSQAGARAAWRLDRMGRAEVYARVVSSGRLGDGVEGAAGVSVQPMRGLPVRLSVERRQQLAGSGGRSAFAAFASGGVSDVDLPLNFQLDGYAAAGIVGVRRRDLFAEGSATMHRRVVEVGPVEVNAGAGVWAAAQPNLERVDVGPGVSARWRVGELRPRLSVDWRQRVVGDAAPQSGVAVTVAADF